MKNLKEFKALIKRYESITLKEITIAVEEYGYIAANKLTGKGVYSTCTLCKAVKETYWWSSKYCDDCVYGSHLACVKGENEKTYDAMSTHNPKKLYKAYRNRAKHMRIILIRKGIDFRTLTTKEIKFKKEFIQFLKDRKVYTEYMKLFKEDSQLPANLRYDPDKPKTFDSFLRKIEINRWAIDAFTWTKGATDWETINNEWYKLATTIYEKK